MSENTGVRRPFRPIALPEIRQQAIRPSDWFRLKYKKHPLFLSAGSRNAAARRDAIRGLEAGARRTAFCHPDPPPQTGRVGWMHRDLLNWFHRCAMRFNMSKPVAAFAFCVAVTGAGAVAAAERLPRAFHGTWASELSECSQTGEISPTRIDGRTIVQYESGWTINRWSRRGDIWIGRGTEGGDQGARPHL